MSGKDYQHLCSHDGHPLPCTYVCGKWTFGPFFRPFSGPFFNAIESPPCMSQLYCRRYLPSQVLFSTDDGEVDDGTANPTLLKSGPPVNVNLSGENGEPVTGATVALNCGDPRRSQQGIEQGRGTYRVKDAVLARGHEDCDLVVEVPG